MRLRLTVAVFILVASSLIVTFAKREAPDPKTEEWMVENSPAQIEGFVMQGGAESPHVSYVMDKTTYDVLDPYGIVARIYQNSVSGKEYDVVLVASQSKESFHDPRVCFSAQGWAISNQWVDSVETKTRGKVPLTIAIMDGPDAKDRIAAYLYKGPDGFYANTQRLKIAMLLEQLKGGRRIDGVFYRVIPLDSESDKVQQITDLKRFIADYLDAANAVSDGYF